MRNLLCTLVGLTVCAAGAIAQNVYRVSPVAMQHGMWRFTPIYHLENGTAKVSQLVGFAAPEATFGENVVGVLYEFSPSGT